MADARRVIGTTIHWATILLAVFGLISTIMSIALFEGDERLWGALQWGAFTIAAWLVGYAARVKLLK